MDEPRETAVARILVRALERFRKTERRSGERPSTATQTQEPTPRSADSENARQGGRTR
jgi:hypothetical protein